MKELILGAFATAMLASPLMIDTATAAPRNDRDQRGRYAPQPKPQPQIRYRNWSKGQRFDYRYARNYQVANNWQQYRGRRLYAPPRGYHWVRSGNDAVLVAITGGLISAVLAGAFN